MCRVLGSSLLPIEDPCYRVQFYPAEAGVNLIHALGFFHVLGFEQPSTERVKILAASKPERFCMAVEFGLSGLCRLSLLLSQCRTESTTVDLGQELFGDKYNHRNCLDMQSEVRYVPHAIEYSAVSNGYALHHHLKPDDSSNARGSSSTSDSNVETNQ